MAETVRRYTVTNEQGEFLASENLLLLPDWTTEINRMWVTMSEIEAQRVAKEVDGTASILQFVPIPDDPQAHSRKGVPITVQQQAIALYQQGLSYRRIAKLLSISKSTVGNIVTRH